jgi:hypothetical protein
MQISKKKNLRPTMAESKENNEPTLEARLAVVEAKLQQLQNKYVTTSEVDK